MFDTKPPDNAIRTKIEKGIVEGTNKALQRWRTDQNFESEVLNEVLEFWYDLKRYYEIHEDFNIGIVVVRDYLDLAEHLSYAKRPEVATEANREELGEALIALNVQMEEIILAVNQRLYPDGDR